MSKLIECKRGRYKATYYVVVDDEDYDWLSSFEWLVNRKKRSARPRGVYTRVGGKNVLMHRLIVKPLNKNHVHHCNFCSLDNRKSNLLEIDRRNHYSYHNEYNKVYGVCPQVSRECMDGK